MRRLILAFGIILFAANCGGQQQTVVYQRVSGALGPAATGPGSNLIWVSNFSANSLTAYQVGQTGNIAPTQVVSGLETLLNAPFGIFKTGGELYVVNAASLGQGQPSITEYPVSANGDVAPSGTIAGPNTLLDDPSGVAVSPTSGRIYVANERNSILTFPNATGDIAPLHVIAGSRTQLNIPCGIAVHSGLIYVANENSWTITAYRTSSSGNRAPIATIAGPDTGLSSPCGLKFDKDGNLYVANMNGSSITVYAPGASNDAIPIATISGPDTLLSTPRGVALNDQNTRLFVINQNNILTAYDLPANGDVVPFMAVTGSNTLLAQPLGIAF